MQQATIAPSVSGMSRTWRRPRRDVPQRGSRNIAGAAVLSPNNLAEIAKKIRRFISDCVALPNNPSTYSL